jgi:hypothetical protein
MEKFTCESCEYFVGMILTIPKVKAVSAHEGMKDLINFSRP